MQTLPYLLDILKYTIAGIGVVWVALYLFKPYLDKAEQIQGYPYNANAGNGIF